MSNVNTRFVEQYQIMLLKEPKSKVFAPLAEAYRKMGMIDAGIDVCKKGLENNPQFPSGRIALANLLIAKKQYEEALVELQTAVALVPENILAQETLAFCLLRLERPKDALKAFKMVLFLNPQSEKALKVVKKLESLTADEYDKDLFKLKMLDETLYEGSQIEPPVPSPGKTTPNPSALVDRHTSLVDAFIARNDLDRAKLALIKAEKELGPIPEIQKRKQMLGKNVDENYSVDGTTPPEVELSPQRKVELTIQKMEFLKGLQQRIKERTH